MTETILQTLPDAATAAHHANDTRLEPVYRLLADDAIDVLSLDFFDTLVWRRVAEPADAFLLVAERLQDQGRLAEDVSGEAFARMRERAEARARSRIARRGGVEVTLEEIYAELPARVFGTGPSEEALATELEVERGILVPDLDVVELARWAREHGKQVVCVSDTYLSEHQVGTLIADAVAAGARVDRVFTSSGFGTGKSASLFKEVLRDLGREGRQVVHLGDNEISDVEVPRRLGIHGFLFERRSRELADTFRSEQPHARSRVVATHGDFGLTALRSKTLHRPERAALPEALEPYWTFGATVLGPVVTGFAEWVHERAEAHGARRVFCLMREGALLARLVNWAGAYVDSDVTAETLWLSREVCARASIHTGEREELERLLVRRVPPTVGELCDTLGVGASLSSRLRRLRSARLDDAPVRERVLDHLSSNDAARAGIVAASTELRERLTAYLERTFGDDSTAMLVDLGWGGTIQQAAADLLSSAGDARELRGVYLMTNEAALERSLDGLKLEGFLGHLGFPEGPLRPLVRSPEILEQAFMPPHGSQVDLTPDLEPVLAPSSVSGIQMAQINAVQKGMLAFQREWSRYASAFPQRRTSLTRGAQPLLLTMLVRAIAAPAAEEARILGRWVHEENFGSRGAEGMLDGHAARALHHLDPEALLELPMTELYWPFGAAVAHDLSLARAAEALVAGQLAPDAFASTLETGEFQVLAGGPAGYSDRLAVTVRPRRNRLGLSLVRATLAAKSITSVLLAPVQQPCVIRLDWIAFRVSIRGVEDPVELRLESDADLQTLRRVGTEALSPRVLVVGAASHLVWDVSAAIGSATEQIDVYRVDVECAFAALPIGNDVLEPVPLAPPPLASPVGASQEWRARVVAAALQLQARTGMPVVPALLRARWLLRRTRSATRKRLSG